MSFRVLTKTKMQVKQTNHQSKKTKTLFQRTRRRRRETLRRHRDISPTRNKRFVGKIFFFSSNGVFPKIWGHPTHT